MVEYLRHKKYTLLKADLLTHKRVWLALADTYLDKELSEADWNWLLQQLQNLRLSQEQLIGIDILELYPVLSANLTSIAGRWTYFEEEEILSACLTHYAKPWTTRTQWQFWWRFQVVGCRKAFWR